jgi:hypothetical protein
MMLAAVLTRMIAALFFFGSPTKLLEELVTSC